MKKQKIIILFCSLAFLALIAFVIIRETVLNPFSNTVIRSGLKYKVGPVEHTVPDLKFSGKPQFLLKQNVLDNQYKLAKQVFEILNDAGIVYWVDGGTLIGLERHEGFIPWDDDIDITVPVDQHKAIIQLKPKLESVGLELQEVYFGWKIQSKNFLKHPFVDIFYVQQTARGTFDLTDNCKKYVSSSHFDYPYNMVFPLKMRKFEDILVWAPNKGVELLQKTIQPDVMTTAPGKIYSFFQPDHHMINSLQSSLGLRKSWYWDNAVQLNMTVEDMVNHVEQTWKNHYGIALPLSIIHKQLKATLFKLHNTLTDNNIDYILSYGNLLGLLRDGDFIPWDDDSDILVNMDDMETLKRVLTENGFRWIVTKKVLRILTNLNYDVPFIDVFPYRVDKKGAVQRVCPNGNIRSCKKYASALWGYDKSLLLPSKAVTINSMTVKIPNKPVELLKFWYGDDCFEVKRTQPYDHILEKRVSVKHII